MSEKPRDILASKGIFLMSNGPVVSAAVAAAIPAVAVAASVDAASASPIRRMKKRGRRIVIETCREAPEGQEAEENVWVCMNSPRSAHRAKNANNQERQNSPGWNCSCCNLRCFPLRFCDCENEEQYEYTVRHYCTPTRSRNQDVAGDSNSVTSDNAP